MKTVNLSALIKTKSNYKNLNGTWLQVSEIVGSRVSCTTFDEEMQKPITIDFTLKEIVEFKDI